jgi:hypothetical protein
MGIVDSEIETSEKHEYKDEMKQYLSSVTKEVAS